MKKVEKIEIGISDYTQKKFTKNIGKMKISFIRPYLTIKVKGKRKITKILGYSVYWDIAFENLTKVLELLGLEYKCQPILEKIEINELKNGEMPEIYAEVPSIRIHIPPDSNIAKIYGIGGESFLLEYRPEMIQEITDKFLKKVQLNFWLHEHGKRLSENCYKVIELISGLYFLRQENESLFKEIAEIVKRRVGMKQRIEYKKIIEEWEKEKAKKVAEKEKVERKKEVKPKTKVKPKAKPKPKVAKKVVEKEKIERIEKVEEKEISWEEMDKIIENYKPSQFKEIIAMQRLNDAIEYLKKYKKDEEVKKAKRIFYNHVIKSKKIETFYEEIYKLVPLEFRHKF